MSIVKTKTKMKSGTIAIIALSIVLVLSLITTITLAYFTAARSIVTTINFANGVRLQMTGAYETTGTGTDIDAPADQGPKTLYWKATYASSGAINSTSVGTYSDVDAQIYFENLGVKVIDMSAAVAIRVAITATKASGATIIDLTGTGTTDITSYVQPMMASANWTPYTELAVYDSSTNPTASGWFRWNGGSSPNTELLTATTEATSADDATNLGTATAVVSNWTLAATVNDFAGVQLVCTVTVFASNTLAGLTATVDEWNTTNTVTTSDATNKVGYAKAYSA